MNLSVNYLCNKIFPYLIFFSCIFHFILVSFFANYVYVVFLCLGLIINIFRGLTYKKEDIYLIGFMFFFLIYSIFKVIIFPVNLALVLQGISSYFLFPAYWISLFTCKSNFNFESYIKFTVPYVLLISIASIIQFYFSPDLFGLLIKSISDSIHWAKSGDAGVNYKVFFRATSFLSSPQVFGLFTILYIFLIDELFQKYKYINFFLIGIVVLGSIHSGNKMTYLILLIFIFDKFFKSKKKLFFLLLIFFISTSILLIALFSVTIEDLAFLKRIFLNEDLITQETDGRFKIYSELLNSYNWIWGKYPGYINSLKNSEGFNLATESYFLLILLDNGLLILLGYFTLFLLNIIYFKQNLKSFRVLNFSIFVSMIFVHAHTDPVFFVFFGIIFYGITFNLKSL